MSRKRACAAVAFAEEIAGQRIDAARAVAALAGKSPVEVLVAGAEEAGRAAADIEGASRVACEDGKREG